MPHTAFDYRLPGLVQPVRRFLLERPFLAICGLLALVSLVFLVAPELDLAVSRWFADPTDGFDEYGNAILVFLRETGVLLEWMLAFAVAAPLIVKFLAPESRLPVRPRTSLFVLSAWIVGPGLLVNGLLKTHWGRARPREIVEFGGESTYFPVWWISDQCDANCSFVSGEAASAFWLLSLAFIVPIAWRTSVTALVLVIAASVSFTRVATGGHFLSDVLIAWLLTLLVLLVLHRLVLKGLPPDFDPAVEATIGRAGRKLRRFLPAGRP